MPIYRLGEEGEEATPVLRQGFPGSVDSWTPALDTCLERGGRYAWSIRAQRGEKESKWSAPRLFQVAAGPNAAEFEAALQVVRQYLAAQGQANVAKPAPVAGEATIEEGEAPLPSAASAAVPESPATVSLVTDGAVGVGTSTPLADLHVVGGESSAGLLIGTSDVGDGGVAELMLAENDAGTWGMKLRYDGATNQLILLGEHATQGEKGPWLEIERDSGAAAFGGVIPGNGSGLTNVTASDLVGGACVSESELDFDPATQAEMAASLALYYPQAELQGDGSAAVHWNNLTDVPPNVANTTSGDAVAGEIVKDKKAWVDG